MCDVYSHKLECVQKCNIIVEPVMRDHCSKNPLLPGSALCTLNVMYYTLLTSVVSEQRSS